MALTTVAELRTALGVGTLYTDAVLQSVCDAADNVLLPFLWKNQQYIIAHGNTGTVGTLYFDQPIRDYFYVGQSVTISGAGTKYNGTKTITGVGTRSFTVTTTHTSDNPLHTVEPYGIAAAETYADYTTSSSNSRSVSHDLDRHLAEPSSAIIRRSDDRWLSAFTLSEWATHS
jgi:hypothetical protein